MNGLTTLATAVALEAEYQVGTAIARLAGVVPTRAGWFSHEYVRRDRLAANRLGKLADDFDSHGKELIADELWDAALSRLRRSIYYRALVTKATSAVNEALFDDEETTEPGFLLDPSWLTTESWIAA